MSTTNQQTLSNNKSEVLPNKTESQTIQNQQQKQSQQPLPSDIVTTKEGVNSDKKQSVIDQNALQQDQNNQQVTQPDLQGDGQLQQQQMSSIKQGLYQQIYQNQPQFQEKMKPFLNQKLYQFIFLDQQQDPVDPTCPDLLQQNKVNLIQSGLYYFVKGLFNEFGFETILVKNVQNALENYELGAKLMDTFCLYRLSYLYSGIDANFQNVQVDNKKALLYLSMSGQLMDIQYTASVFDIYQELQRIQLNYEEGQQAESQIITEQKNQIPDNQDNIFYDFLILMSQFKLANQAQSQKKFQELLVFFEKHIQNPKIGYKLLIYLVKLMSHQTSNSDKQIKQLLTIANKANPEIYLQVFKHFLRDMQILSLGEQDNDTFIKNRQVFFEFLNLYRKLYTQLPSQKNRTQGVSSANINNPLQQQQQQGVADTETIKLTKKCIFYTVNILFQRQPSNLSQFHRVLCIRSYTEVQELGYGGQIDLQGAYLAQKEELTVLKQNVVQLAYPLFHTAKLMRKIDSINTQTNDYLKMVNESLGFFKRRITENNIYGNYIAYYYIGRINQIFLNDMAEASKCYTEGQKIYYENKKQFQQLVRTFQFELYHAKYKRKVEQFNLPNALQTLITQQNEQDNNPIMNDLQNQELTNKVLLIQQQDNLKFFDIRLLDQLELLHKAQGYTTYKGVLKLNLMENQINSSQKHSKYLQALVEECNIQKQDGEKIVIKQFPVLKMNFFEEIFKKLQKTGKIDNREGLLQIRGYAIKDISAEAFELFLIYKKLHKNLYEIVKTVEFTSLHARINFAIQICNSLLLLHKNGLQHLNLKPNNILLDKQLNRGVIGDWEFNDMSGQISKNSSKNIEQNEEDIIDDLGESQVCIEGFSSPEQQEKNSANIGFGSDIFSLGMILYYIFWEQEKNYDYSSKKDFKIPKSEKNKDENIFKDEDSAIKKQIQKLIEDMTVYNFAKRAEIQKIIDTITPLLKKCKQPAQSQLFNNNSKDNFNTISKNDLDKSSKK